ncbi:MAG: TolC family protein [Saprospiraceae bacterium]|nr:TolC family protein [Saprospiraceae bacterium]
MNFNYVLGVVLLLNFCMQGIFAQQQVISTLDQVIQTTIANNFGIQIAEKNKLVASNNASRAFVGYNPTVNAAAGGNFSLGGSTQKFGNGNENVVTNAPTYGGNANVTANYMLYDETRALSLDQLRENLNLMDLQLRQTIETNVLQAAALYYQIAKLEANASVLKETIEVSNKRLERVTFQYDYGQGLALDVLNAQVDVQRDSINYFNALQLLENAERDLNVIMGIDIETSLVVDTSVTYASMVLPSLETAAQDQNINLLVLEKNQDITNYDLELIEAEKKPTVAATGAYNFNFSDNPPGAFITFSNNRGLNLGVTATMPLYDGGLRKIRTQNTQINLQTLQIQREQVAQQVHRDLVNAWTDYENALFILRSEGISLSTSEKNFDRTVEQFNLGQVSSVEFRQAQLNLLNATTSYINAKYDAKIIELELKQIAGLLLQ